MIFYYAQCGVCVCMRERKRFDLRKPEIINKNDLLSLWCGFMCTHSNNNNKSIAFLAYYEVCIVSRSVHPYIFPSFIYDGLAKRAEEWIYTCMHECLVCGLQKPLCAFFATLSAREKRIWVKESANDLPDPSFALQVGVERILLWCLLWLLWKSTKGMATLTLILVFM